MSNTYEELRTEAYEEGYNEGAIYVLQYLADVFEGVEDTDVWQDFFGESEETHD